MLENWRRQREDRRAAVSPKSNQLLWLGCECKSLLPLPAPAEQTQRPETGGEECRRGREWRGNHTEFCSESRGVVDQQLIGPTFSWQRQLRATNDSYGLLFAVTQRNRYGLRGAARDRSHDNWCRRRRTFKMRTSMDPIPRNIKCACIVGIARCRLRNIYFRLAIRRSVEKPTSCRPVSPCTAGPVAVRRSRD
jgi:hypothetical protein